MFSLIYSHTSILIHAILLHHFRCLVEVNAIELTSSQCIRYTNIDNELLMAGTTSVSPSPPPRPAQPPLITSHMHQKHPFPPPPPKYCGRSTEELLRFCEEFCSKFQRLLLTEDDNEGIIFSDEFPSPFIVEGLRPVIVSQLFSAGIEMQINCNTCTYMT